MASGPFTMAAGDTQEVVVAEIAAQGSSNINSVSLLKAYDKVAQDAYDKFFVLPSPPRIPNVSATGLDQQIVLNWGFDLARVDETESLNKEDFTFQGYNVYQLPDPTATKEEAVRIATFDLVDGIKAVKDRTVDPVSGEEEIVVVQFGGDYGVERSITINKNYINNLPLNNGSRYYFAVTSYAVYNQSGEPDPVQVPNNLENPFIVLTVVPQSADPGVEYGEEVGSEIDVEHTTGLADGTPVVTVVDPSATTGHEYELFFTQRQEVLTFDGDWISAGLEKKLKKPLDLTGTEISIGAAWTEDPNEVRLDFALTLKSPTNAWADGVTITLPAEFTVVRADSFEAGGGTIIPEVNGNVITMGLTNGELTQNGIFHGGETWSIVVSLFTPPADIAWRVHDDGYADPPGPVVDAEGEVTISLIGEQRLALYWNVRDLDAGGAIKLENQPVVSGVSLFPRRSDLPTGFGTNSGPVMDGVEVILNGSYDAPTTFLDIVIEGTGSYDLDDFTAFGYADGTAHTSLPLYGGAGGTLVVDNLQQDYEIRWTGVTGDSLIGGNNVIITKSGGSMATLIGASNYSIADHPCNPNPGNTDPFIIPIPFEVWNIDKDEQVNLLIYDRNVGARQPTDPDFQIWNTVDRMYCWVMNTAYSTDVIDHTSQAVADNATWSWAFFESEFVTGDVITTLYANPFQIGADTYRFETTPSTYSDDLAADDVEKINVFPNPYYGVNPQEINKYERFVTINHLPDFATIRIFNLAGQLVRTIEKTTPGQFERWDLLTDSGLPVASGLYIIYVDMPELGRTKILKAAVIQEQQILDRY